MIRFTALMSHSEATIRRFTKVQYNTFEFARKCIVLLLAVVLILFGASQLFGTASVLGIASLLIGCVVLTNRNARSEAIADEVAKAMHGTFPCLHYLFSETGFSDGKDRPEVPYTSLFRLIADDDYLYLFTSKASGYMIEAASISAADTQENALAEFKAFLAERSSLVWTRPLSLWSISLRDVRFFKKH